MHKFNKIFTPWLFSDQSLVQWTDTVLKVFYTQMQQLHWLCTELGKLPNDVWAHGSTEHTDGGLKNLLLSLCCL